MISSSPFPEASLREDMKIFQKDFFADCRNPLAMEVMR